MRSRKQRRPGRPKLGDRDRLKVVGVRLSPNDLKALGAYCERHHRKQSAAIRHMIRAFTREGNR